MPFARSMNDVQERKVDFHLPLIQMAGSETGTDKFDYSTETVFHVTFALYSNKKLDINPENVSKDKVETDDFTFLDNASDPIIKQTKMIGMKRQLFKPLDVKIILPKGGRGGLPTNCSLRASES